MKLLLMTCLLWLISLNQTQAHVHGHRHHQGNQSLTHMRAMDQQPLNTEQHALNVASELLQQANQPGQEHLYGKALSVIKPWLQDQAHPDLWVTKARIDQHQHRFDLALNTLQKVLHQHPHHQNAHLMAARMHLINRSYSAAKQHCLQLETDPHINLPAVCLLEVASHQGQLEPSYALLKQQLAGVELAQPYRLWVGLMLSDMALRLGSLNESQDWLELHAIDDDVSYLVAWAETQLKLKQPQAVIKRLTPWFDRVNNLDDGLMLQLALAEQQLNLDQPNPSLLWKQRMQQRIAWREADNDLYHASEIARYYLLLAHDPEQARHWAEINWQQTKEPKDHQLLQATGSPLAIDPSARP